MDKKFGLLSRKLFKNVGVWHPTKIQIASMKFVNAEANGEAHQWELRNSLRPSEFLTYLEKTTL